MMTTDLFTSYLDASKTAEAASEQLREAIVMTVIANTAAKMRVDSDILSILKEEAKQFAKATSIIIVRGDEKAVVTDCNFHGNKTQIMNNLLKLICAINRAEAWYEDRQGITVSGQPYEGFCWEGPGEDHFFCGYPLPQESRPGDWDYEGVAEFNPKFAEAQRKLSEYEGRWNSFLHAKQCGNPVDIDKVKALKKQIAELRDTTVYGEVRDGADSLMAKIEKWNIH